MGTFVDTMKCYYGPKKLGEGLSFFVSILDPTTEVPSFHGFLRAGPMFSTESVMPLVSMVSPFCGVLWKSFAGHPQVTGIYLIIS